VDRGEGSREDALIRGTHRHAGCWACVFPHRTRGSQRRPGKRDAYGRGRQHTKTTQLSHPRLLSSDTISHPRGANLPSRAKRYNKNDLEAAVWAWIVENLTRAEFSLASEDELIDAMRRSFAGFDAGASLIEAMLKRCCTRARDHSLPRRFHASVIPHTLRVIGDDDAVMLHTHAEPSFLNFIRAVGVPAPQPRPEPASMDIAGAD
jgi:hypothetical protein